MPSCNCFIERKTNENSVLNTYTAQSEQRSYNHLILNQQNILNQLRYFIELLESHAACQEAARQPLKCYSSKCEGEKYLLSDVRNFFCHTILDFKEIYYSGLL